MIGTTKSTCWETQCPFELRRPELVRHPLGVAACLGVLATAVLLGLLRFEPCACRQPAACPGGAQDRAGPVERKGKHLSRWRRPRHR